MGKIGSEMGMVTDTVSDTVSPVSLLVSLTVFGLRKLTTRVFFFRRFLECFPTPRPSPVVAELKLTKEGREVRNPDPCYWRR